MKVMYVSAKLVSWFAILAPALLSAAISLGQDVVSNEFDSFPEASGWERATFCAPTRELANGVLLEEVEVGCGGPPGGHRDTYSRDIAEFAGVTKFFFEWRVQTTGERSEILGVAPCSFVTADLYGVNYHFTIANDQMRLIRDNFLPIVFVDIEPEMPHTHRLELRGPDYWWFIDGEIVDAGIAEGPYPTPTAVISWRTRAWYLPNTTWWSYIRYGHIPDDASADYDSDFGVTLIDHYFVVDCLTKDGPGIYGGPEEDAGPGCRFADFNDDSDVDLLDFAQFQNAFGSQ